VQQSSRSSSSIVSAAKQQQTYRHPGIHKPALPAGRPYKALSRQCSGSQSVLDAYRTITRATRICTMPYLLHSSRYMALSAAPCTGRQICSTRCRLLHAAPVCCCCWSDRVQATLSLQSYPEALHPACKCCSWCCWSSAAAGTAGEAGPLVCPALWPLLNTSCCLLGYRL
jgi:hypothetical protein